MTHLTQEQRYIISAMLKAGRNKTEIALEVGKNKSSIKREIDRNKDQRSGVYRPCLAINVNNLNLHNIDF